MFKFYYINRSQKNYHMSGMTKKLKKLEENRLRNKGEKERKVTQKATI